MKRNSILFVGCGDIGIRTGAQLLASGWEVGGVRRDSAALPEGFTAFAADYALPGSLDFAAAWQPDYVVASFNPSDRSEQGYHRGFTLAARNLLAGLGEHRPRALFMISSTRVFAEREGGWVNEDSALARDDPRAQAIIAAEQLLLDSPQRACVLRFAGIYGAPGSRLLAKIRRGQVAPAEPLRYGNRIHREDCAGVILHLLERSEAGLELAPVYLGVDDLPAPRAEVERWLATRLGLGPQLDQPADDLELAPGMPANSGNKRCSNRLLTASGYRLIHPDYRSGYEALLAAENAGSAGT